MRDIDHIKVTPDQIGWTLHIYDDTGTEIIEFGIGDANQFHNEVERTIGRWLADGPADFHAGTHDDESQIQYGLSEEDTDHGR